MKRWTPDHFRFLCLGVNRAEGISGVVDGNDGLYASAGPEDLAGAEPVCMIRLQELNGLGLSVGDKLHLILFNITYPGDNAMKKFHRLGAYDVTIIRASTPL